MAELTTLAKVKRYLGIDADDTSSDDELTDVIEAAEEQLRRICNRPDGWTSEEHTETFDGEFSGTLVLTYTPIDTTADFTLTVDESAVDSASYVYDDRTGILRLKRSTTFNWDNGSALPFVPTLGTGFGNVSVVYTGGYAADSMPAGLVRIATEMTAAMFRDENQDPGIKAETLGNHSITYTDQSKGTGFFATWKERVGPYVRHDT